MKATLKYTNCLNNGRRVFSVLSRNDVQILRTKSGKSIYPQLTIRVGSYDELNLLVQILNKISAINWDIMAIENLFGIFLLIVR